MSDETNGGLATQPATDDAWHRDEEAMTLNYAGRHRGVVWGAQLDLSHPRPDGSFGFLCHGAKVWLDTEEPATALVVYLDTEDAAKAFVEHWAGR